MRSDIIFHEVYGVYYRTVGRIINSILECKNSNKDFDVSSQDIMDIIAETAFKESLGENSPSSNLLATAIDYNKYAGIIDGKFKNGKVVYDSSLKHPAKTPMTLLEKRWLKTISDDPRVKLFSCKFPDLSGIEPLYNKEDIHYTGQYFLGDDYNSEEYILIFKTVFNAIKEKCFLKINYASLHEGLISGVVEPQRLQYSIKEDRFRLIALMDGILRTFNLSRMQSCELEEKVVVVSPQQYPDVDYIEVIISNNRSAIERFLLYFSNYERRTTKLENGFFKVKITFPKQDETEVLVNALSFIPMVKIVAPEEMKEKFLERIEKQKELLKNKIIEE